MNSLRPLFPYISRHRWALIWGVIFVLITNALTVWVPVLVGMTVNLAERRQIDEELLRALAVDVVLLALLAGCFRFLMRRVLIDASRDIEYEFRNDLFAHLQRQDATFFDGHNTGDIMSRTTNDMDAVRMAIGPGVMYVANTFSSLPMALVGMALLDWQLTIVAMIPMFLLPPLVKYFSAKTHLYSRQQQDVFGDLTTMVQENLAGMRVVKAYRQEDAQEVLFTVQNDRYIAKSMELAEVQASFFPAIRVLVGSGFVLLVGFGGYRIMSGELQAGTLLTFFVLFSMLVWPLIAIGWSWNLLQRGRASLDRLNEILDRKSRVADGAAKELPTGPLEVEFRNLTFQYDETPSPQLSDISLKVPAGRTLGIVGPVGSGKSTLVNLLGRYYPVPPGTIFLGGLDVNDWPLEKLRAAVSTVFQETFLFSDTIGWNIRFGSGENVPQSAVDESARQAALWETIEGFPKRFDTVLGERGVNLSGGQKQRTAIARALLKEAAVLILDDSLSAVDTHTEEQILSGLKSARRGRTTLLVSHRISTIAMADEIIVLEGGRITQRGRHADLIEQPGLYAELHRKQLSEADVEAVGAELAGEVVR